MSGGEALPEGVRLCVSPGCERWLDGSMAQCCTPCINRAAGSRYAVGHAWSCDVRQQRLGGKI